MRNTPEIILYCLSAQKVLPDGSKENCGKVNQISMIHKQIIEKVYELNQPTDHNQLVQLTDYLILQNFMITSHFMFHRKSNMRMSK